jgi:hypothetical protein
MTASPWRQRVLFGVLALTVALTVASGERDKAVDEPVMPLPRPVSYTPEKSEAAQPRIELERLRRQETVASCEVPDTHAFRAMSWYVPPPPPPPPKLLPPPPPPPPTAPPMPFSFLGRYEEGETKIIMLVRGERLYTVSEGEVVDSIYRVERLTGGQLELTYLPLNIKQTISAGGT